MARCALHRLALHLIPVRHDIQYYEECESAPIISVDLSQHYQQNGRAHTTHTHRASHRDRQTRTSCGEGNEWRERTYRSVSISNTAPNLEPEHNTRHRHQWQRRRSDSACCWRSAHAPSV